MALGQLHQHGGAGAVASACARPRLHTGLLPALLTVLCAATLSWPSTCVADLNPGLDYGVIGPDQGERVMALVAPWVDGAEVAPGVRLSGASIEHDRACYSLQARRTLSACLVMRERLGALNAVHHSDLPADAALALVAPTDPDEQELRTFDQLAGQIARNAESAGLGSLWHRPVRREEVQTFDLSDDLAIWLPLICLWLIVAATHAVRDLPLGGWPWVAGLLGLSAWTRLTLPVQAPMNAWSWTRVTSLGSAAGDSQILMWFAGERGGVYFDDLQSWLMRLVSIVTPIAVLGHGRKLFGASWPALFAAMLLAVSPHALRFAAADDQFTPSMLWSSTAFFWLYATLETRTHWRRALRLLVFAPLLILALTARPLNIVYAPLMLTALAIASQRGDRNWRLVLGAQISALGGWVAWQLLQSDTEAVHDAVGWSTVTGALELLLRADFNPLLFWRLTPPAWLLLIVFGAFALVRGPWPSLEPQTARLRGIWLVCWLFGYIVLHGVVVVDEPMNNARYQLHSLPAMAMLAGAGLWAWWLAWQGQALRRGLVVAVMLLCLAAPWLHRDAIADVAFDVMRERAFLNSLRDGAHADGRIPPGCNVIEIMRPAAGLPSSKIERVGRLAGLKLENSHLWLPVEVQHWQERSEALAAAEASDPSTAGIRSQADKSLAGVTTSLRMVRGKREEADPGAALLSARGRAILADPPSCLVFYEGPECAQGPSLPGRHAACSEILASGTWQLVAETHYRSRLYDRGLTWHLRDPGDPVALRVWRRTMTQGAR